MTFMPAEILQTVQRPDTQKCLQKAIGSMQRLPYQPFHRKGSRIRKICTVISKMLLQIAKPFYKPILLIPPNRLSMINSGIRMLQPSGCKISCHHCKNNRMHALRAFYCHESDKEHLPRKDISSSPGSKSPEALSCTSMHMLLPPPAKSNEQP